MLCRYTRLGLTTKLNYMERMGATASKEAMMMPISQMLAVSRRAQVGSPLALPCPKTCRDNKWDLVNHILLPSCRRNIARVNREEDGSAELLSVTLSRYLSRRLISLSGLEAGLSELTRRNGMIPSLEIACRRRGAPVRL